MDRIGDIYREHERAVLRACMARVHSPELAADLTAETFAAALLRGHEAADEPLEEWRLRLADAQLLRAYRTGAHRLGARSLGARRASWSRPARARPPRPTSNCPRFTTRWCAPRPAGGGAVHAAATL